MSTIATPNRDPGKPSCVGYSRLLHGLAVTLTIAVFPLIWVGGLVTTYDAGMAVPDWPGTYGQNMFVYSAWLYGPFDLLVEHGHRLLGSLAGLLSIGLVAVAFWRERRRWFVLWTFFVLIAVVAQGALGGFRVLLDERTFAMIHGCTGPLFFAMATATAVMSSRWWLEQGDFAGEREFASGRGVVWLATLLVVFSYIQLIVGAQLRHVTGATPSKVFMMYVHSHLTLAGLVALLALILAAFAGLSRRTPGRVSRPAFVIVLLVFAQVALGIATWIVNYALPWQEIDAMLAAYTIQAKGYAESLIVTAHVATGSLIISLGTMASLRAWRTRASHAGSTS